MFMKLLYCLKCDWVVRLIEKHRECECWHCWWRYIDTLNAVYYWTQTRKIGFDNNSFWIKIRNNLDEWILWNIRNWKNVDDWDFNAFIIWGLWECSKTFIKKTKKEYNLKDKYAKLYINKK